MARLASLGGSYLIDQWSTRLQCWHALGTGQPTVLAEHLVIPRIGLGIMQNLGIYERLWRLDKPTVLLREARWAYRS